MTRSAALHCGVRDRVVEGYLEELIQLLPEEENHARGREDSMNGSFLSLTLADLLACFAVLDHSATSRFSCFVSTRCGSRSSLTRFYTY